MITHDWYCLFQPQWMKNFGFQNWTVPLPVSLEIEQEGVCTKVLLIVRYHFVEGNTSTVFTISLLFHLSL